MLAKIEPGNQGSEFGDSRSANSGCECKQVCEITKHVPTLTPDAGFNHRDADAGVNEQSRAVAGLMLFDESDILDTLAKLETLKEEVERTMFRLPSLTKTTAH